MPVIVFYQDSVSLAAPLGVFALLGVLVEILFCLVAPLGVFTPLGVFAKILFQSGCALRRFRTLRCLR